MKLRISTENDRDIIKKLYEQALKTMEKNHSQQWSKNNPTLQLFYDHIGNDLHVFEEDNKVIGMGMIQTSTDEFFDHFIDRNENWATIRKLTANKGYGLPLTKALVEKALLSYETIYIDTSEVNKGMISIVETLEFTKLGKEKRDNSGILNICYKVGRN